MCVVPSGPVHLSSVQSRVAVVLLSSWALLVSCAEEAVQMWVGTTNGNNLAFRIETMYVQSALIQETMLLEGP